MTTRFEIQSACECQAILEAELNEQRHVLTAWAHRGGTQESAPANSVGADSDRFDVVWHCPMCGRNTLRTFYANALRARPAPLEPPSELDEEPAAAPPE